MTIHFTGKKADKHRDILYNGKCVGSLYKATPTGWYIDLYNSDTVFGDYLYTLTAARSALTHHGKKLLVNLPKFLQ